MVSFWEGTVELTPASDNWVDTVRMEARVINNEGNFASVLADAQQNMGVDQNGFTGTIWNAWQTNWGGTTTREINRVVNRRVHRHRHGRNISQTTTQTQETVRETWQSMSSNRTGTRTAIVEQFDTESLGDRTVSRDLILFLRSRNIQFVAKRVKPLTRMYPFFDGQDVSKYCLPKLLEIEMSSGVFQVGETVVGTIGGIGVLRSAPGNSAEIVFRVAQPNHKGGPYNIPTSTFSDNPYTYKSIPSSYSASSTLLNVDIRSMADEAQGDYYGRVETNMVLTGQSSGAQARITNVRLVTDTSATLIGSFFVPDPNLSNHPRFETGKKVLQLTNDPENNADRATTQAEEQFDLLVFYKPFRKKLFLLEMQELKLKVFLNLVTDNLVDV